MTVRRQPHHHAGKSELTAATWTHAFRIGNEIVASGMTAHPASQQPPLSAYEQTSEVLRKLLAYVEVAGCFRPQPLSVLETTGLTHMRGLGFAGQGCNPLRGLGSGKR